MKPTPASPLKTLLTLSHELGREERRLAILGEGNTSARSGKETFLVKASGSNLSRCRNRQMPVRKRLLRDRRPRALGMA